MSIAESLQQVKQRVADAARACGRDEKDILLIGASKMNDAERVREAMKEQEKAFARVLEQPAMRKIMEVFHVDPEGIRFTFNPDRTSK